MRLSWATDLFDQVEVPVRSEKTCRTCIHLERHAKGGSHFHYCGITKSGRTTNGLLKVKCKTKACLAHKEKE